VLELFVEFVFFVGFIKFFQVIKICGFRLFGITLGEFVLFFGGGFGESESSSFIKREVRFV